MKNIKYAVLLVISIYAFTGCLDKKDKETTLEIVDNNRHYYPILQGQELDIVFNIKNTGNVPFILKDILTSCGCVTADNSGVEAIPPGKEGRLVLKYNSNKNMGVAKHFVTLYGNLKDAETIDVIFDVNVISDGLYTKDYEELYQKEKNMRNEVKDFASGKDTDRSYYLNGN